MRLFNIKYTFGASHYPNKNFPRASERASNRDVSVGLSETNKLRVTEDRTPYDTEIMFTFKYRVLKNGSYENATGYAFIRKSQINTYLTDIEGALDYTTYMAIDKKTKTYQFYVLEAIQQYKKLSIYTKQY